MLVRYSLRRLLEIVWWSLRCFLNIRRETIADSVTAPAIVPNIMPAKAPLLRPDFVEGATTVTSIRAMGSTNQNYQSISYHRYMNEKRYIDWCIVDLLEPCFYKSEVKHSNCSTAKGYIRIN